MKNIAFASFAALAIVGSGLTTGCAAAPADDGTAAASDSNALQSTGGGLGEIDYPSPTTAHCRGTADCNNMLNNICKAYPYCDIEEGQIDCICWTIPATITAAPSGARANAGSTVRSAF